jgi:hypothetical protein
MTADTSTVAWIGAGGVVIGAIVGALSGWASAVIASKHTRSDARTDRRRDAYAAFIGAVDQILSLLLAPDPVYDAPADRLEHDPAFAESLSQTLGSIDHAYVSVAMVGSKAAQKALEEVQGTRWRFLGALRDPEHKDLIPLVSVFAGRSSEIIEIARSELA